MSGSQETPSLARILYGDFLHLASKIVLPNTQPRAKQAATVREQNTDKFSHQWVPTNQLMAQGDCDGNLKIWIPKRALPTSNVTSAKPEAIKISNKGKQIIQKPALAPIVSLMQAVQSTYGKGESSCKI